MRQYLAKFSDGGQVEFQMSKELGKQELQFALKQVAIEYGITGKIVDVTDQTARVIRNKERSTRQMIKNVKI